MVHFFSYHHHLKIIFKNLNSIAWLLSEDKEKMQLQDNKAPILQGLRKGETSFARNFTLVAKRLFYVRLKFITFQSQKNNIFTMLRLALLVNMVLYMRTYIIC